MLASPWAMVNSVRWQPVKCLILTLLLPTAPHTHDAQDPPDTHANKSITTMMLAANASNPQN